MSFEGSCHCAAVKFEVQAPVPTTAISCNCSHCRRKGFLLSFIPAQQFTLLQGENELRSYTFNTHKNAHLFCQRCGKEPFANGANHDGSAVVAVILSCVPTIDWDRHEIQERK